MHPFSKMEHAGLYGEICITTVFHLHLQNLQKSIRSQTELLYKQKIDIYVRRQDPYGVYGLYDGVGIGADISGDDSYTEVVSDNNYVKSDDIKC